MNTVLKKKKIELKIDGEKLNRSRRLHFLAQLSMKLSPQ